VGGTTLSGTITANVGGVNVKATIPAQRAWGWDWLWPDYAKFGYSTETSFAAAVVAGGGGGYSSFEPVPLYQEMLAQQSVANAGSYSAVQYLMPTDYGTGTPGQVFNPGSGLGYPDLAKLAGDFG
jgi:kumamolisin